jgi:hypothetical protein
MFGAKQQVPRTRGNATKKRQFRQPKEAREMSIKSVLGVAVILGLACAQAQASPKRHPWGDRASGRDLDVFRHDVREAARLRREIEASERDDDDPNKGWSYVILTIHHGSGYSYVHPTPYGMYASKADCEQARAEKVNALESNPNNPTRPATHPIREQHLMAGGPVEVLLPKGCVPNLPSLPGSQRAER